MVKNSRSKTVIFGGLQKSHFTSFHLFLVFFHFISGCIQKDLSGSDNDSALSSAPPSLSPQPGTQSNSPDVWQTVSRAFSFPITIFSYLFLLSFLLATPCFPVYSLETMIYGWFDLNFWKMKWRKNRQRNRLRNIVWIYVSSLLKHHNLVTMTSIPIFQCSS